MLYQITLPLCDVTAVAELVEIMTNSWCRWTSTLAWQAGNAQGLFLVGTLIQSLITINDITYMPAYWHGTLLVMGITAIALCANVFGARMLPYWQNIVFVVHILAYFAFLAPVWVNAPRVESSKVWSGFENTGGWPSLSLAVLIGQMPGITSQVGIDTVSAYHNSWG